VACDQRPRTRNLLAVLLTIADPTPDVSCRALRNHLMTTNSSLDGAPTSVRPERRMLRFDQRAAVDAAVRHLKRPGSRGHIVSACGTGKTLTALRAAEALDARHLLVAVPSLDLIGQWAAAARADGRREPLMAVSSSDARKHPVLAGAGAVSTGSGEYLAYWLAQRRKRRDRATVFVTLDSLPRIEESQHSIFTAPVFDLLVVDFTNRHWGVWDVRVE
jgi:predicted helicase